MNTFFRQNYTFIIVLMLAACLLVFHVGKFRSIKDDLSESRLMERQIVYEKANAGDCYGDFLAMRKAYQKRKTKFKAYPMMDDANVKLVCDKFTPETSVLEWGCGGSTAFYSRYVKKWVCIEHQDGWGQIIYKLMKDAAYRDIVSVNVIPPNNPDFSNTWPDILYHDGDYEEFKDYVEFPASLNEKFDLIFDDGRARVPVAQSVIRNNLLTENGVLIIHDWERSHYKVLIDKDYTVVGEDTVSKRHLAVLKPIKH